MSKARFIDDDDEPKDEQKAPEPDLQPNWRNIPESNDVEAAVSGHLSRIKKFCFIMLITSPILPIVSWFVDPYHFVFYQAILNFIVQLYIAYLGHRATKTDHYSRIEYFKKAVNAFYAYFLITLVLNQVAAILVSTSHNDKNCGKFVNNRVCVNRTGAMTTQLVTLLFSPGLDFSVWIFYRYLLTVLNECQQEILKVKL
jgi:hypothetical protein